MWNADTPGTTTFNVGMEIIRSIKILSIGEDTLIIRGDISLNKNISTPLGFEQHNNTTLSRKMIPITGRVS